LKKTSSVQLFTVVGILILMTVVYGSSLTQTLQCDEASTFYKYASNPASALFAYTTPNNHLLHSFLMWVTTSIMGMSHIAIRYTAFMAGILSIALSYRIGRRLRNHYSGIGAMIILGTNINFVKFMLDGRGYTLSILLLLMFIELLIFASRRENKQRGILEGILAFCLLMVLPSMVLYILAILLFLLIQFVQTHKRAILFQMVAVVFGCLLAFLFYIPAILNSEILTRLSGFGEPTLELLALRWINLTYTPASFGFVAFVASLLGFVLLYRHYKQYKMLLLIALTVAIALVAILAQFGLTGKTMYARNYLYLVPILAIVGGIGLGYILRRYIVIVAYGVILIMSIFVSQIRGAEAITQLIEAIPQYQPDIHLMGQHACHILPAYYELTVTQGQDVNIVIKANPQTSILAIPVGLKTSVDEGIALNLIEREKFGECRFVNDEFDMLDIYVCEAAD